MVNLPDLNYLVGRILFAIGSPSRYWHNKLEELAYLCELYHFQKSRISRPKVLRYWKTLSGSNSAFESQLSNVHHVALHVAPADIVRRIREVRKIDVPFDYDSQLELVRRTFGKSRREVDPLIPISAQIHRLSRIEKMALTKALDVSGPQSERGLWNALYRRFQQMRPEELRRLASLSPAAIAKRFMSKRTRK